MISAGRKLPAVLSMLLGLGVGSVGIDPTAGHPRFTFGNVDLMSGISFIPAMIGAFAVSELLRSATAKDDTGQLVQEKVGAIFRGIGAVGKRYWRNFFRGSLLGTAIGALPGAGADIAAWMSFAMAKRFSKEPEKFGTGHVEGVVESTSSNNAALGGAWIPALVFGIPGDSITAIVIGVLYMKGMNPGPTVFLQNPQFIYAVFIIFVLANLLMLPLGWAAIKARGSLLRAPRALLSPIILMFCIVGSFAITNSTYGIVVMLVFGLSAGGSSRTTFRWRRWCWGSCSANCSSRASCRRSSRPTATLLPFFTRPIAGVLGVATILVWGWIAVGAWGRADRGSLRRSTSGRE